MDLGSRYLGALANTRREVMLIILRSPIINNVASRIIYELGTCTGAIRRLRFDIVNIEIMQHVFVIKKF
jgi:hypothetical protein